MDILLFTLGEGRYALPAIVLRQVVRAVSLAPLPKAPGIVEGAIDYHGTVVPVLDIRARLGLAPKPLAASDHFLIAATRGRLVGLRVDGANALIAIDPKTIERPDRFAPKDRLFAGLAKLPDGLVLIQDLDAFLSEAEAAAIATAMPETAA